MFPIKGYRRSDHKINLIFVYVKNMTSRKPAKVTKPIIFYNGLFHYVEDNETDDVQFALFKVYNLNVHFHNYFKRNLFFS